MKRAGGILILLVIATALDGCLWRIGAPCAGYGCPVFAPTHNAQLQQAPAQTAQNRKTSKHKKQAASSSASEQAAKAGQ